MKLLDILNGPFPVPHLTRTRMAIALGVAVGTDGLQLLLASIGPVGFFLDEMLDVVAMVLTTWAIGFHLFLLPTFVAEALPIVGMLPTWTGCVIAVIAMRKSEQHAPNSPPPKVDPAPPADNSYIDV
jgi:hypothetical protein